MLMPMIGTMDAAAVSDESTSYFPSVVHFVNMSPKAVGIGRGSFADPSVTPDDVTSISPSPSTTTSAGQRLRVSAPQRPIAIVRRSVGARPRPTGSNLTPVARFHPGLGVGRSTATNFIAVLGSFGEWGKAEGGGKTGDGRGGKSGGGCGVLEEDEGRKRKERRGMSRRRGGGKEAVA